MFASKEIDVLIEAIDAWESAPSSSGFTTALLGVMLGGITDETKEEKAEEFGKSLEEGSEKAKARKETATLLRAKLIQMRNEIGGQELVEEAQRTMS